MLEQAVSKTDFTRDRRRIRFLRALQAALLLALVTGELFGVTMGGVYWETDRALFWQSTLMLLAFGLPIAAVIALLQLPINRLRQEFDYLLQGNTFSVYRITGNRRKRLLSFELSSVALYMPCAEIGEGSPEARLLRSAVLACCNAGSERLTLVCSGDCFIGKRRQSAAILLELNDAMQSAFAHALRIALRGQAR